MVPTCHCHHFPPSSQSILTSLNDYFLINISTGNASEDFL